MGPKKDVVRLFRKATLEQDLKFGVSEHLWRQLGLNKRFRARRGNNTDPPD